jgi:hypothetical protein
MGYFAVLQPPGGSPFSVAHCHINLWVLSALGGNRYFLDVGLNIQAGQQANVAGLQLALPFGTDKNGLQDLTNLLTQPQIADLIFGVPTQCNDKQISFNKEGQAYTLTLTSVLAENSHDGSRRIEGKRFYSLWELKLATPIPPNEKRYFRVRFLVSSIGRTWLREGRAVLFDMRVADIRESVGVTELNKRKDHIVAIDKLYLFLIAPTLLELRRTEPPTHYMRLLEGGVWKPYLRRRSSLLGTDKLTIHQWRGEGISAQSPYRVFASFRRQPVHVSAAAWLGIVLVIVFVYWGSISGPVIDAWDRLWMLGNWVYILVAGVGFLTIAKIVPPIWRFFQTGVPKWFGRLDRLIYGEDSDVQ